MTNSSPADYGLHDDPKLPGHAGPSSVDLRSSCQYASDNPIYFKIAQMGLHENATTFAVSTQWHILYKQWLEKRFVNELGAVILVKSPSKCGWSHLAPVVKHGVHRGEIQWYYPHLEVNGLPVHGIHEPPFEIEAQIVHILVTTFPKLEIALCIIFPVGFILTLGSLCFGCRRIKKSKDKKQIGGIPQA